MRPLTAEDYRDIWDRRKWLFLGCWIFVVAITCLVVVLIPAKYQSTSVILLEGPPASDSTGKAAWSVDPTPQLQALIQQAMSRARLDQVARETGMVGATDSVPDSLIDMLKNDIDAKILTDHSRPAQRTMPYGLSLSFTASNPASAQKVDNELATFIVAEKRKIDERASESTQHFLQAQLGVATRDLQEKQQRLLAFEERYRGQLPIDEQLTLQLLAGLERDQGGKEQQLGRMQESVPSASGSRSAAAPDPASKDTDPLLKLQARSSSLQASLADLESRYQPNHPDILRTREEIARVKVAIAQLQSAAAASAPTTGTAHPSVDAKGKLDNQTEVAALKEPEQRVTQRIAQLQANLQVIPAHAEEFSELERDYKTAKDNFDKAQSALQDAKLASGSASGPGQMGLRIQDFASLPDKPVWPVRWKANLGALAGGLLLALCLIGGLELRDSTTKSEKDIEYYLEVKNLATIPELQTPMEMVQRKKKGLVWSTTCASVALLFSGALLYLYFLRK